MTSFYLNSSFYHILTCVHIIFPIGTKYKSIYFWSPWTHHHQSRFICRNLWMQSSPQTPLPVPTISQIGIGLHPFLLTKQKSEDTQPSEPNIRDYNLLCRACARKVLYWQMYVYGTGGINEWWICNVHFFFPFLEFRKMADAHGTHGEILRFKYRKSKLGADVFAASFQL